MATEQSQHTISVAASTDLSASQYCAVKTSSGKLALAGNAEDAIGILLNDPAADGQPGSVCILGVCPGKAGAAVSVDDNLGVDSSGRLVPAATGDYIVGRALEAASAANVYFKMLVRPKPNVA